MRRAPVTCYITPEQSTRISKKLHETPLPWNIETRIYPQLEQTIKHSVGPKYRDIYIQSKCRVCLWALIERSLLYTRYSVSILDIESKPPLLKYQSLFVHTREFKRCDILEYSCYIAILTTNTSRSITAFIFSMWLLDISTLSEVLAMLVVTRWSIGL